MDGFDRLWAELDLHVSTDEALAWGEIAVMQEGVDAFRRLTEAISAFGWDRFVLLVLNQGRT